MGKKKSVKQTEQVVVQASCYDVLDDYETIDDLTSSLAEEYQAIAQEQESEQTPSTTSEAEQTPIIEPEVKAAFEQMKADRIDRIDDVEPESQDENEIQMSWYDQKRQDMFGLEQLQDTIAFLQEWKQVDFITMMNNVDLDSETKQDLGEKYFIIGWIHDLSEAVLVSALQGEWNFAKLLIEHQEWYQPAVQGFGWKTLRMLIGNWDNFRDRKLLKELCIFVMQKDAKAMPQLNKWAIHQAKKWNRGVVKGYCDLCVGDSKQFAMMYSEL